MRKDEDVNSTNSFYYTCGLLVGRNYGDVPREFKLRIIEAFKRYIDSVGGPQAFVSEQDAVDKFFNEQKRKRYGRRSR